MSDEVELALLKKRVEDLELWQREKQAQSEKTFWAGVIGIVSIFGFIATKLWEKVSP